MNETLQVFLSLPPAQLQVHATELGLDLRQQHCILLTTTTPICTNDHSHTNGSNSSRTSISPLKISSHPGYSPSKQISISCPHVLPPFPHLIHPRSLNPRWADFHMCILFLNDSSQILSTGPRHWGFKTERDAVLLSKGCIFLDCFPSSQICESPKYSIGRTMTDITSPGAGVLCYMGLCVCFCEFSLENVRSQDLLKLLEVDPNNMQN